MRTASESAGDVLLDVNVVLSLLDPSHIHHDLAHEWLATFRAAQSGKWATCPLVENGVVRIASNPSYVGRSVTVREAASILAQFAASPDHVFWPDSISMLDSSQVDVDRLTGHRQVTDAYLVALAVHHGGRLVTFDGSVPTNAVPGAQTDSVISLV